MKPGSAGANFRRLAMAAPVVVLAVAALMLSSLLGLATFIWLEPSHMALRISVAAVVWMVSLVLALRALRTAWRRGAESTSITAATVALAFGAIAGGSAGGEWALTRGRSVPLGVATTAATRDCFETLMLPDVQRDARNAAGPEDWAQDVRSEWGQQARAGIGLAVHDRKAVRRRSRQRTPIEVILGTGRVGDCSDAVD